ncbi:antA/AntB antirepressor family protein [Anaerotignum sp. MB30-C6]|uniref:antA/AntB antirepressor family protein n=1 Tax=Anaerotignum sp. MB30-C6 TaxID=3070814 RepID=UPI0027DCDE67|nr:antA/AntB antirepressor family protein [Anaerotignum sp. MB30-C6]WMI81799.1 antA/AntB antirepressor family protein [Anaerotignum sp. MB30-C6]
MNQLTLFEQGLVPVYKTDQGEHVVNGRELWEGLQSKSKFADWIKNKFAECEAVENEDFESFSKNLEKGGRPTIEYIIKLDTAKEMAMLERNEIGKSVRKYFIAVEKKSKQVPQLQQLTPELQMIKGLFDNAVSEREARLKQAVEIEEIKEDVRRVKEKLTTEKQVEVAPVQTEITLAADVYSKTMKKDRISTERVAGMYCVNSRAFYDTLYKLGLVIPGTKRGWRLNPLYENKGLGFNENATMEYSSVSWSQKGVKIIKDMLKNNGVTPIKRLPPKKKVVSRKGLI